MGSPLDLLPPDIIINIFCRLAVHSILQCKRVCRTWRSIIFDINFAHMHLKSIFYPKKNSFLLFPDQIRDDVKTCNGLCIREFDDENNNYGTYNWIYHSPIDSNSFIIGSCNGLICLSSSRDLGVRVCNPITREYITLPSLYPSTQRFQIGSGFGFINSPPCGGGGGGKQEKYKVVRIYYHFDNRSVGLVHVYTVGDGRGWRYKGEVAFELLYTNKNHIGVFANGSLYWLLDGGVQIACFDLAQEEFRLILLPLCIYDTFGYYNRPFFSRGLLCFLDRQSSCGLESISIRIWSLKKNDEWEIIFHLGYESMYLFEPLAITKRGELLFSAGDRTLCCYNPKTETSKLYCHQFLLAQAIPHVESFVSLKALGEYDVKIVESENISMKWEEGWRSPKKRRHWGPIGYIK